MDVLKLLRGKKGPKLGREDSSSVFETEFGCCLSKGLEDFTIERAVGQGSFGKVYKVTKKDTNHVYAMKELEKRMIFDTDAVEQSKLEEQLHAKVSSHPFIVNLRFAFQTEEKLYIILDYVEGGDLLGLIMQCKCFAEDRARLYAAEIYLALNFLHEQNIIYRDLKLDNILVDERGHIRLTDFGLATAASVNGKRRARTFCGTPECMAPEILTDTGVGYGLEVDWWAFGICIYVMLTGQYPFHCEDQKEMYQRILTEEPPFPPSIRSDARDLISKLLNKDPNRRLKGAEIEAHPFFKGIDFLKVFTKKYAPEAVNLRETMQRINSVDNFKDFDFDFTASHLDGSGTPTAARNGEGATGSNTRGFSEEDLTQAPLEGDDEEEGGHHHSRHSHKHHKRHSPEASTGNGEDGHRHRHHHHHRHHEEPATEEGSHHHHRHHHHRDRSHGENTVSERTGTAAPEDDGHEHRHRHHHRHAERSAEPEPEPATAISEHHHHRRHHHHRDDGAGSHSRQSSHATVTVHETTEIHTGDTRSGVEKGSGEEGHHHHRHRHRHHHHGHHGNASSAVDASHVPPLPVAGATAAVPTPVPQENGHHHRHHRHAEVKAEHDRSRHRSDSGAMKPTKPPLAPVITVPKTPKVEESKLATSPQKAARRHHHNSKALSQAPDLDDPKRFAMPVAPMPMKSPRKGHRRGGESMNSDTAGTPTPSGLLVGSTSSSIGVWSDDDGVLDESDEVDDDDFVSSDDLAN